MKYPEICKGPNPKLAEIHQEKAKFHEMMAKFYKLEQENQLVFMAAFDQMVKNHDLSKGDSKGT